MAAITSITESWNGHSFSEVESHIKSNYLPTTNVSVGSISSGVASVLTLNSSNAVKKTSLSDLASLLGGWKKFSAYSQGYTNTNDLPTMSITWAASNQISNAAESSGYHLYITFINDAAVEGESAQMAFNIYTSKVLTRVCASGVWKGWI